MMTRLGIVALLIAAASGCGDMDSQPATGDAAQTQTEASSGGSASKSYGDFHLQVLASEFQTLMDVARIDDANRKQLQAWHGHALGGIKAWYAEFAPEIVAIRRDALEAAKSKNLAQLRALDNNGSKQRLAELTNNERQLLTSYRADLEEQLPPELLRAWQTEIVARQLLEFLLPLELTDEQRNGVHGLSPRSIAELNAQQHENWRGYGTSNLERIVEQQVLNESQRAAMDELKQKNRTRMLKWSRSF